MANVFLFAALFLILLLVLGILRVLRGPTNADRLMATQLFGTQAVAILLLLGGANMAESFVDVALVFSLLAAVTTVAFVRRPLSKEGHDNAD